MTPHRTAADRADRAARRAAVIAHRHALAVRAERRSRVVLQLRRAC